MLKLFKTDSDEDVIFISEKPASELNKISIDQAKRLVLQREIDQESQPKQSDKLNKTTQRFVVLKRPVEIKMEEEKSEDMVIKKEKKREQSQPESKSCTADVKTEKKSKKNDGVEMQEACWTESGERKDMRKKRKIESDSLNSTNNYAVDGDDKRAKKKKKRLLEDNKNQEEIEPSLVKGEKKYKKEKVKNKFVQSIQEYVEEETEEQKLINKEPQKAKTKNCIVSTDQTEESVKEKKKKKALLTKNKEAKTKKAKNEIKPETPVTGVEEVKMKKRKKKVLAEGENGLEAMQVQMDEDDVKRVEHAKEKKSKKKKDFSGETENEKDVDLGIKLETTKIKVKSKKKKKEAKSKENGNGVEVIEIKAEKKSELEDGKISKKKKNTFTKSESVTEEEEMKVKKKMKKQHTTASVENDEEKAPKKKVKVEEEQLLIQQDVVDVQSKKHKKKKSAIVMEQDAGAEAGAKKKKRIKKELEDVQESSQVDVVFLSAKGGNSDEITINQERRLALQMEIDKASQPENPPKPAGLGQWSTAQFDSSEQQHKFLRLMGGFKKGLQPTAASTGGTNMAMGKKAQQQLQQGLLGEFERAQSRRMVFSSRGAGLGFTAPSNKKFNIDINACRSVRFDD